MDQKTSFLRSRNWCYPLKNTLTTVGKKDCDITINNSSLDEQHCTIEHDRGGNYFLRDLATKNGTYINDCRITKASVRLINNDKIRFGNSQVIYQYLEGLENSLQIAACESDPQFEDIPHQNSRIVKPEWIKKPESCSIPSEMNNLTLQNPIYQDKHLVEAIEVLKNEIAFLRSVESKNNYKDEEIKRLKDELSYLSNQKKNDGSSTVRLNETKFVETPRCTSPFSSDSRNDGSIDRRFSRTHSALSTDKLRKECQILTGLVNQLQKEKAEMDKTLSSYNEQISLLKSSLHEKTITIDSLTQKFEKQANGEELRAAKEACEKEVNGIRQRFKIVSLKAEEAEIEVDKLRALSNSLKEELHQARVNIQHSENENSNLKNQLRLFERERSEWFQSTQDQNSRHERFKIQLVEMIRSLEEKGKEYDDAAIVQAILELLNRRNEMQSQITHLKSELNSRQAIESSTLESIKKFIATYGEIREQLHDIPNRRSSQKLKSLASILETTVANARDPIVQSIKSHLVSDWQEQAIYLAKCESSIQSFIDSIKKEYGFSYFAFQNDMVFEFLPNLLHACRKVASDYEESDHRFKELSEDKEKEIERMNLNHQLEIQDRVNEAVRKTKFSEEVKTRHLLDEITNLEDQKRDQALKLKEEMIDDLQNSLERARQTMTERSAEYELTITQLRTQLVDFGTQIKNQKSDIECNQSLKEKVQQLTDELEEKSKKMQEKVSEVVTEELKTADVTIKGHLQTIGLMEERLAKLIKQSKDHKLEAMKYKKELKSWSLWQQRLILYSLWIFKI